MSSHWGTITATMSTITYYILSYTALQPWSIPLSVKQHKGLSKLILAYPKPLRAEGSGFYIGK